VVQQCKLVSGGVLRKQKSAQRYWHVARERLDALQQGWKKSRFFIKKSKKSDFFDLNQIFLI